MIDIAISRQGIDKETHLQVKEIIKKQIKYPDWNLKESIRSELMKNIKRVLIHKGISNPGDIARKVVNNLIHNI